MRNVSKYLPLALWAVFVIALTFLVLPWPRSAGPAPGQLANASPAPESNKGQTTLIYGQSIMPTEKLMEKIFGKTAPVAVKPAATPAVLVQPSPAAVAFGPDPGLKVMGSMIVDQNRKWLLSDPATGLTFAISPGETYAGWRCVSFEGGFLILERGGTRYRVAAN